jgi:subtilisin family serine protease
MSGEEEELIERDLVKELESKEDATKVPVLIVFSTEKTYSDFYDNLVKQAEQGFGQMSADQKVITGLPVGRFIEAVTAKVDAQTFDDALARDLIGQQDEPSHFRAQSFKTDVENDAIPEIKALDAADTIKAEIPAALIKALGENDVAKAQGIEFVEPIIEAFEDVEQSAVQIGVQPNLRGIGLTGRDIKVAVLDTGVDEQHPDLQSQIIERKDTTGKGLGETTGHATHVASTILGTGAASNGKFSGIAPGARLFDIKVLHNGGGTNETIILGIEEGIKHNVDLMNLSLGTKKPSVALRKAVNKAVDAGIVMLVAAGNWQRDPQNPTARLPDPTIGSPGDAEKVITVGAANNRNEIGVFSSRGPVNVDPNPNSPLNDKPDVVSPGVNIIAARGVNRFTGQLTPFSAGSDPAKFLPAELQQYYTSKNGTSMATPVCAGLVGLMLEKYYADGGKREKRIEQKLPLRVKAALMETATPLTQPGLDKFDYGRGFIEGPKALNKFLSKTIVQPTPTPGTGPTPGPSLNINEIIAALRTDRSYGLTPEAIMLRRRMLRLVGGALTNRRRSRFSEIYLQRLWNQYLTIRGRG